MGRTTISDVKDILDNTGLSDSVIGAYVSDANVFVTAHLTGEGLSDAIMKLIEKWICGHMITMTRERVGKEEGAGGAYIKYIGSWGQGLMSTSYGQMAVELDSSDTLLKLAQGKKEASIRAVESFDD